MGCREKAAFQEKIAPFTHFNIEREREVPGSRSGNLTATETLQQ
jgi:hypothetical protein